MKPTRALASALADHLRAFVLEDKLSGIRTQLHPTSPLHESTGAEPLRHTSAPLTDQSHVWLHDVEECVLPERNEVHVWRAELNQEASIVRACYEILQPEEQQRADKFHFPRDREHFVVARAVLRQILGGYLSSAPEQIRFTYNQYGKPALAGLGGDDSLCFNVSHSKGIALYAIARGRRVGLDIEHVREDFDALTLAERFFSPAEVAALRELLPEQQIGAFFNCWTRKEAYIKALGEGLSHPLAGFSVSLAPGEPAALLSTDDDAQEASRWSLVELSPGDGYVAALACEGHRPPLVRCRQWCTEVSRKSTIFDGRFSRR